ncbi:indolin-2-one monooxygenase [Dichanthelium oligosanthes]|uniref:Indolin-2-one monooxygenase n=1 Tax=Dichanthelium oligosanthes TaxID=888268 RepID=A0A1E5UQY3_9POAL|nr:indolin-2-one monooxygenase [Dichanthelium oligosanthes]
MKVAFRQQAVQHLDSHGSSASTSMSRLICHAVLGRLPREEGRNKVFLELLKTNSKLLGGFNLEVYFPSLARLGIWATAYWESAEEFMAEQFMEGAMDVVSDYQGNDFHLLPFGSGRRMCPGMNFAVVTFKMILANLVHHFNWELPPGSPGVDMAESFAMDVHRKEKLLLIPRTPVQMVN